MRRSRALAAAALVATTAMVLAACSGSTSAGEPTSGSSVTSEQPGHSGSAASTSAAPASGGPSSDAAPSDEAPVAPNDDTITFAYEQEWYAYNQETANGNATANNIVLNGVFRSFTYIDSKGAQVEDTELGTIQKVSDDPLTVKYTYDPHAVWSDGQPIGCADFLLDWAANSGVYNADGTTNTDPSQADPSKLLFATASTAGWDQTEKPTCTDGDKSVTLVYQHPFADWHVIGGEGMPAHVVARQAGVSTAGLIDAIENDNAAVLKKAAAFWNTGWDLDKDKGLPDAALIPSGGPYLVSSWDPGQSVTLTANPKWWGTPAKTGTIVIRFISQENQVQALQSGEVDVIEPQPTVDAVKALQALGSAVTIQMASDFSYEHIDLSTKNAFKDAKLREAFFRCVPRDTIVANLIKPVNDNAVVLNSLMLLPFQAGYAATARNSGFENYTVDLDAAKAAFKASGATAGTKIRLIHLDPNPRRTDEVALIKQSCDRVGFDIVDTPLDSNSFGGAMTTGDYDAALFAWAGSGVVGATPALYMSNGSQNFSGWSGDKTLDDALGKILTTVDPSKIPPLLETADKQLATDMFSLPLFAFPGLTAFASDIEGVQHTPAKTQATWNVQDWARSH